MFKDSGTFLVKNWKKKLRNDGTLFLLKSRKNSIILKNDEKRVAENRFRYRTAIANDKISSVTEKAWFAL